MGGRQIYPVWFCPTRIFHHSEVGSEQWLFNFPAPRRDAQGAVVAGGTQFLDVGLYGVPRSAAYKRDHVWCQRGMEEIVRKEKGFMFNYSVGYSTFDEFWQVSVGVGVGCVFAALLCSALYSLCLSFFFFFSFFLLFFALFCR